MCDTIACSIALVCEFLFDDQSVALGYIYPSKGVYTVVDLHKRQSAIDLVPDHSQLVANMAAVHGSTMTSAIDKYTDDMDAMLDKYMVEATAKNKKDNARRDVLSAIIKSREEEITKVKRFRELHAKLKQELRQFTPRAQNDSTHHASAVNTRK